MRLVSNNITTSLVNALNEKVEFKIKKLDEATKIWSSDQEEEYWNSKSLDELRQEFKNNYDYEDVNGVPFEEATEEDFLEFLRPENLDEYAYEDFMESILPEIKKQCAGDYLVLCGEAANWHSRGHAAKITTIDEADKLLYDGYEKTVVIGVDNGNLFYTEYSHDVPTGFTLGLYSFKSDEDIQKAEAFLKEYLEDEEFDMYYFTSDYIGCDGVDKLIEQGLLTPIKNTINNYTGNEKEEK
jgi:hypothetical protein